MATPESLLAALAPTPYACTSLAVLTGGYGNYTYRGTLAVPLPCGAETVVVKHAEGYVPGNREWAFSVTRSIHEASLLLALSSPSSGLPPIPSPNGLLLISSTKLLHYDLPTHTQVLADFPSSLDLKSHLTTHGPRTSPAQATHLGHSLGIWLSAFHAWANPASPSAAQTAARATMRQNAAMGDLKHFVNFGRLGSAVALFPEELDGCAALFADVEATMKEEMDGYKQGAGELIHGDFWCGNILLADLPLPRPLPDSAAETQEERCVRDIVVIDWELSHFSTRAADVAQLLAELFLLSHFRGLRCAVDVMEGFLAGYGWEGGEGGRDREMAFRVAVAMGTHLVVFAPQTRGWDEEWDARDWEGGEGKGGRMRECVVFGRDVICHAWGQERDARWFSGGVLERLFSSSSQAKMQTEEASTRSAEMA